MIPTTGPSLESWRTLAREQAKLIERMEKGLRHLRVFLDNPQWGTVRYMEGSEIYGDVEDARLTVTIALGETNDVAI